MFAWRVTSSESESDRQYDFRAGHSTDEALRLLRDQIVSARNAHLYTVAVNLNI